MKNLKRLILILTLAILAISFTSCSTPSVTFYAQNTHQYWDTVDIYILRADSRDKIPSSEYKLQEGVTELHHFEAIRTNNTNEYQAKTFKFTEEDLASGDVIYEVAVYNGEIFSSGSGGFPKDETHTILTLKNNGGAYNYKSYTPKNTPDGYKKWDIIADPETKQFLGID